MERPSEFLTEDALNDENVDHDVYNRDESRSALRSSLAELGYDWRENEGRASTRVTQTNESNASRRPLRVMVCAPSNKAVTVALEQYLAAGRDDDDDGDGDGDDRPPPPVLVGVEEKLRVASAETASATGGRVMEYFVYQVRSIQTFFTHRPVSTFDSVPFQLTDELFLYGMALRTEHFSFSDARRETPGGGERTERSERARRRATTRRVSREDARGRGRASESTVSITRRRLLSFRRDVISLPRALTSPRNHQTQKEPTRLRLVAAALASTASLLELATLVADVRLRVRPRDAGRAEVLNRLARVLRAAEQRDPVARGRGERELIERHALAASLDDPRASRLRESKRAHLHRGHFEHARVVRDGPDDRGHAPLVKLRELRQRQRRAVDLGHEQTLEDGLVEVRVRAAREEAVELHEELEVDVFGLWRGAVLHLVAPARFEVDPLR